jgi:hypothetical protein
MMRPVHQGPFIVQAINDAAWLSHRQRRPHFYACDAFILA